MTASTTAKATQTAKVATPRKPRTAAAKVAPAKVAAPVGTIITARDTVDRETLQKLARAGRKIVLNVSALNAHERSLITKDLYHAGYNNGFRGNWSVKSDKGVLTAQPKDKTAPRTELRTPRATVKASPKRKPADVMAATPVESETGTAHAAAVKLAGKTIKAA